jgi:hypothetical protein
MNSKRKTRGKKAWQAIREPYRWHFLPPYNHKFDRSHWLKNNPEAADDPNKAEPSAALYELTRRHPTVGEALNNTFDPNLGGVVGLLAHRLCLTRLGGFDPPKNFFYCASG